MALTPILSEPIGLIGYWVAPFCTIVLTEQFVFRPNRWSSYKVTEAWNRSRHPNLPRGYAALFTFGVAVGLVVLTMEKTWWTGPVPRAGATGDLGMLVSFVGGVLVYIPARWADLKWLGSRAE